MFRKNNWLFIFLLSASLTGCLGKAELPETVLQQANEMGDAFLQKDYDKYSNYIMDWVLDYAGGKKHFTEGVQRIITTLESRGKRYTNLDYKLITEVVENDDVYQCILIQTTVLSGEYASTNDEQILFAASEDAEHWKFATITYMPKEKLKEFCPYLHPDLKNPNWSK